MQLPRHFLWAPYSGAQTSSERSRVTFPHPMHPVCGGCCQFLIYFYRIFVYIFLSCNLVKRAKSQGMYAWCSLSIRDKFASVPCPCLEVGELLGFGASPPPPPPPPRPSPPMPQNEWNQPPLTASGCRFCFVVVVVVVVGGDRGES